MLQGWLGLARTTYLNLAVFAVVVLVIAIWVTDDAVLIPDMIVSGIIIQRAAISRPSGGGSGR